MSLIVDKIISGNEQIGDFWGKSHGWAPPEAAELMSKSRLDWQVQLSHTLKLWADKSMDEGHLILAWTNLGALVEGTLKLFLSVYYKDYQNDINSFKTKEGLLVEPDSLYLEKLKQFFRKNDLLSKSQLKFVELVQQRRNAIHAFKDRPVGTSEEYFACLEQYLELLRCINGRVPYPDDQYVPRF